ncbi:MAG TPA: hypothetical protein VFX03_04030 [Thermomicrobiales bacterium]|nr:hypothetical protein [Thermomicrobiales bacterium]
MHRQLETRILTIGGGIALAALLGVGGAAPAAAQRAPTTSAGLAACATASVVPACVGGVVGGLVVVPGVAGGDVRGGPLHENGGRDVDVAAHHGRMLAR